MLPVSICRLMVSGMVLAALLGGCRKRAETSTASPPPSVAAEDSRAAVPPRPPANPQQVTPLAADPSATLADLTQALRRFSMERRQVPKTLAEVVAAGYLKNLPAAPPGKQFAINPQRVEVILVNQ